MAIEVTAASPGEILDKIEVVGTLTPKFQAEVKTEYTGVVTDVYVVEWVRVRKGAPLARLDSREVEADVAAARAAMLQAGVAAQRADREYERAVKLKSAGLATQQSLDDARTEKEAAAAAQDAAKARLQAQEARLSKTVIRAPMGGVVAERAVNVGDLVENMGNPPPMFRIVDNSLLELTLSVPSARLAALRAGQPLTFETDGIPGKIFRGSVRHINPATEEISRTARVIADVPNASEELKAGMFAKGLIFTGKRSNVLQIPRSALQNWDVTRNTAAVFVVSNDTARRREVRTGVVSGELVEITSGLTAGEMVVSGGAFNLRDADRVRVAPAKGA
ncbi:MAG: efflux RND transporter periplasmic adaptor subunit [Acidobacteria bacterium]|nr:efflux RND transporter periplasmic adaptor subunit [Acidobacteriota bacterium]